MPPSCTQSLWGESWGSGLPWRMSRWRMAACGSFLALTPVRVVVFGVCCEMCAIFLLKGRGWHRPCYVLCIAQCLQNRATVLVCQKDNFLYCKDLLLCCCQIHNHIFQQVNCFTLLLATSPSDEPNITIFFNKTKKGGIHDWHCFVLNWYLA